MREEGVGRERRETEGARERRGREGERETERARKRKRGRERKRGQGEREGERERGRERGVVHELSKEMHLHRTNVLLILLYNTFVLSLSWGL